MVNNEVQWTCMSYSLLQYRHRDISYLIYTNRKLSSECAPFVLEVYFLLVPVQNTNETQ